MRRFALFLLGMLAAAPSHVGAAPVREHSRVRESLALVEAWVDAQLAYEAIPGISMAIVHDQEIVWARGFGWANADRKTPARPETIYSICSISKLFTSIAVLQLRDEGRLRLDDPVQKHLLWFAIQDTFPDPAPVTIEGLLTHSSGLPRESDFPYWSAPDFRFPTRDEVQERLASQAELYPAWTYFQYSNLGLTLAGEVVAAAAARPFDDYVREHILVPLGMTSTTPEIPVEKHGKAMATGYSSRRRDGTRPALPVFEGRGIAPAMAFASSVLDMAKFAAWQFRVLHHGSQEVLGRPTLREMYRVHWIDPDWERTWGLGFHVRRAGEKTLVGHGGSCPGYRSRFDLQADDRIAVVFMSNAGGVDAEMFTRRAYEIVAPAIAAALDSTAKVPPGDTTLAVYTGTYDQAPWGGEVAVLPWKGKLAAVDLPSTDPLADLVELQPAGPHRFRRVRKDKKLGEEVRFELDAKGRVTKLWWHSNSSPKVR